MKKLKRYITEHKVRFVGLLMFLVFYYYALPEQLFKVPTATLIESVEGKLLGAKIAKDMQWRFPERDSTPLKFATCITAFEDAYFYRHWGVNPVSIFKAFNENRKAGKVVRGGSTITQQVIRLSRRNKRRTYFEKIKELILATRLEFRYSKKDILTLYASHAPFGGNVVGLDAASWRYFGQEPDNLSWAENATLAVLPNAPSLIHIDRNRPELLKKRNRLLKKLFKKQLIDSLTYELAIQEKLPNKTFSLPQKAPHLLEKVRKTHEGKRVTTTVHYALQQQLNQIILTHYKNLKQNYIYNAAAIVIDIKTKEIIAYVGNTPTDKTHQKDVDIIDKPRSTGSILKPFLFTSALNAGELLPHTLLADIPTQIAGYKPENFNLEYYGAVPASKALSKSLNIPAVRMLQSYGLDRFYHDINKLSLTNISKGAEHYGLSLILGGAESSLWNLTRAYTNLASTLRHYDETQGEYYKNEFTDFRFLKEQTLELGATTTSYPVYDAGAIFTTFNAMREVNRPEGDENWEFYDTAKAIAWKTGTSFGFRDAWAIGVSSEYAVGIWVGNADGEGRPGLTGITAAAPILFDVFDILPNSDWFATPYDELTLLATCKQSGHKNTAYCTAVDSVWVPVAGLKTKACPYHQRIHLDQTATYQVNSSCASIATMKHVNWFVLPPTQAYFFKQKNPLYQPLPSFKKGCISKQNTSMEFVDNFSNQHIFLPKDFDSTRNSLIVKVKHQEEEVKIYWYLDTMYVTTTQSINEISIQPKKGIHILTVVDELGNELKKSFEIL